MMELLALLKNKLKYSHTCAHTHTKKVLLKIRARRGKRK